MREIVLDTETTGLKPADGHRLVEIGCVELLDKMPTGKNFHYYINPKRDMPLEAENIHGLSSDFLSDKPIFVDIVDEFLDFLGRDQLVIHNAQFDLGFLNHELSLINYDGLQHLPVVDTVHLARRKFPGQRVNLDALCQKFNIDLSRRDLHGALLDAQLLADVYLELTVGRQQGLELQSNKETITTQDIEPIVTEAVIKDDFIIQYANDDELTTHQQICHDKLANNLWKYSS